MKTGKVREVREERIGKKSKKLVGFLTVIVAGYFVFFTSKIWIPDSGTLKSATHYYQKLVYETYDIYLTQWRYDEKADRMQVIIELGNKEILDQKLEFEAVERSGGTLKMKVLYQDSEFVLLHIEEIPKTWKEISFRVEMCIRDRCVIDGANIIEKLTGGDAGLSSMTGKMCIRDRRKAFENIKKNLITDADLYPVFNNSSRTGGDT